MADKNPDELVERVLSYARRGFSYSHIARATALTRSAVAGIIRRERKRGNYEPEPQTHSDAAIKMNTERRSRVNAQKKQEERKSSAIKEASGPIKDVKKTSSPYGGRGVKPPEQKLKTHVPPKIEEDTHRAIFDPTNELPELRQCKFARGHGPNYDWCPHPREEGKPYCREHMEITNEAYKPSRYAHLPKYIPGRHRSS